MIAELITRVFAARDMAQREHWLTRSKSEHDTLGEFATDVVAALDAVVECYIGMFGVPEMDLYAAWCGKALALSHARSGASAILSGYMGKNDSFDRAIAAFSVAYADQNEKDHIALDRAVRKGKVKAEFEADR